LIRRPVQQQLRFLLDAGVPDGVGAAIEQAGHEAIYHRDVLLDGSPDHVVCEAALKNQAILVAVDVDMKRLARQYGRPLASDRFKHLSYVGVGGNLTQAAHRLRHAMSLVEHEWEVSVQKAARRLWVEIGPNYIRTNR
jgi:hypothetical protein